MEKSPCRESCQVTLSRDEGKTKIENSISVCWEMAVNTTKSSFNGLSQVLARNKGYHKRLGQSQRGTGQWLWIQRGASQMVPQWSKGLKTPLRVWWDPCHSFHQTVFGGRTSESTSFETPDHSVPPHRRASSVYTSLPMPELLRAWLWQLFNSIKIPHWPFTTLRNSIEDGS